MNPATPITPVVALHATDELTDLADTYATVLDELAGLVESSDIGRTNAGRTLTDALGALHVVLDELTVTSPARDHLVALIHRVDRLHQLAADCAGFSHTAHALLSPLSELHTALVSELVAPSWRAGA